MKTEPSERNAPNLRVAAQALVDRLDAIHADPRYQAVWISYQNNGGDYTNGPKYDKELAALRRCLSLTRTGVQRRGGGELANTNAV